MKLIVRGELRTMKKMNKGYGQKGDSDVVGRLIDEADVKALRGRRWRGRGRQRWGVNSNVCMSLRTMGDGCIA
jgi:hypothetical protein